MADLKVLCLALWTPPTVRPQALLIGKMIPHWIRQGMEPIVIGYDGQGAWECGAKIIRMPQHKELRLIWRFPATARWFERHYCKRMANMIADRVSSLGADVVFSFANPQMSNMIGAMLKERLGIPFISHFSDPYYDNPLVEPSAAVARIQREEEAFFVERSDRVVLVSDALRNLVMKKYDSATRSKACVIEHCYDKALYQEGTPRDSSMFVMSHLGAFYKDRNPKNLFRVLREVKKNEPVAATRIRVRLVGADMEYAGFGAAQVGDLISEYGVDGMVEITPTVDYVSSLRIMRESDCLVSIGHDLAINPFLPSKLIDYIGSGTSIFSLAPPDCPASTLMRELGQPVFSSDQISEAADCVISMLNGKRYPFDEEDSAFFSVENQTRRYKSLFKEVVDA